MISPLAPYSAQPSLAQPPIDQHAFPQHVRLDEFVASSRGWGRLDVSLSTPATAALWSVLLAAAGVGGWCVAVLAGGLPCGGLACGIATLGGNPALLVALASSCVVGLGMAAALTRGLTRVNGPLLAVVGVAAAAGLASLVGVLALAVAVALVVGTGIAVLAFITDHIG